MAKLAYAYDLGSYAERRAGSTPVTRTSGKLPPPLIGWRQQKSEPYHTMVGFGFIFTYCTMKKEKQAHRLASLFSVILAFGEFYCFAVIFGLSRVIFAARVVEANIISL